MLIGFLVFNAGSFVIENSYDSAHKKAISTNKMLLVYLTKKNCVHCNRELMKIVQNKELSSLIDKKTVFVIVNEGQKESYPIELLYTREYPALFFLDKYELFNCKALEKVIEPKDIERCLDETTGE